MRRLSIYAVYPGMKVARTLYNKMGQALLSAGTILSGRFIERLKILGIGSLYVEDGLIPDIEVNDIIHDETRARAVSLVRDLVGEEKHDQKNIIKRSVILSKEIMETISEIVDQLLENRKTIVNLVDIRA
ncbi:MAG: HD-GYP domain-containing protein, partial [Desulfocucumaceae bacterium]